jgi:glycerophosphoryl diester phosphodiesterase
MTQVMMPGDANPSGNVHGGVIMKLVDTAAGVCSTRHARRRTVTARIDSMSFLQPVYVGDLVTLRASVNDVGHTSMEVGVRVEAEDLITGIVRHVSSAYLVFVALDDHGRPTPVPPVVAESAAEKQRMSEAKLRRSHRQRGEEAMRAIRGTDRGRATLAAWRRSGLPLVVGHRGAAGHAPENTLPSFEVALELGADAVEMDVHLSRDGIPVVIHDHTVDRTTNGHGSVDQFTARELQALDAGHGESANPTDVRIPTLDEVLRWAKGRTRVVVELKGTHNPQLVEQTIALVREYHMIDETMLISFDHLALQRAKAIEPGMRIGALYFARPADPVGLAAAIGADALCPHWSTAPADLVAEARAAGLGVCVWTANEPAEIEAALAADVDALTSDYPDRARVIAVAHR